MPYSHRLERRVRHPEPQIGATTGELSAAPLDGRIVRDLPSGLLFAAGALLVIGALMALSRQPLVPVATAVLAALLLRLWNAAGPANSALQGLLLVALVCGGASLDGTEWLVTVLGGLGLLGIATLTSLLRRSDPASDRLPVAVLGAGTGARATLALLQWHPRLGLEPVAVAVENEEKSRHAGGEWHGLPVLGALTAVPALLRERRLAGVILETDDIPHERCLAVLSGQRVLVVDGLFRRWRRADHPARLRARRETLGLTAAEHTIKRAVDVLFVLATAPITLPIVAALVLAIKLESTGAGFYRQERIGKGGRKFWVWKLRSMVHDADARLAGCLAGDEGRRGEFAASHKLRADPRLTRLGAWLRRSSLDELPQLWNILRGEMTLVGPRPIVAAEVARYGAEYRYYEAVTPGLTGLWQICGRNATCYEDRVALDAYYVRNGSPLLDLWILSKTISAVLRQQGAC